MIPRSLFGPIIKYLTPGKVIILKGPRRVGKTVLAQAIAEQNADVLLLNGEDITTHELLQRRSVQHYKEIIGNSKMLIIDEAQKVPGIGDILKLIVDNLPYLKILISGSSSFDLHNRTGEPLTGPFRDQRTSEEFTKMSYTPAQALRGCISNCRG